MIKKNSFFNKWGAYIVASAIFFIMAYAYCFPVLKGEVLIAQDEINGTCIVQECVRYSEQTGDHSWWTGSLFCGMPNYQIGGGQFVSSLLLKPLDAVLHRGHSHTPWAFIIYFFCFFALLLSFDVDKWLSIVGATAIALSSYFVVIIATGHGGKASTIALISVVFAGFHLIFRKKYGLGIIFAMVFTALGFSVHPQMAYYIFMLIGLCWFAELYAHIKEKRLKDFAIATALFAGAVGIGLGTGCSNAFANAEYTSQTIRGGYSELVKEDEASKRTDGLDLEYATDFSYGKGETFSLLIPGFKGGASGVNVGKNSKVYKVLRGRDISLGATDALYKDVPMYWGDQPFTSGNVYVGAIVCFLFVLGLLLVGGPYKWALFLATAFSIFLAWGSNWMGLTRFFFNYFPLYNKFRAVSSILVVAEIAMPLLGFLAIRKIMEGTLDKKYVLKRIAIAGGVTTGICLFFAFFGGRLFDFTCGRDYLLISQYPDWLFKALIYDRKSLLVSDSWRSAALIVSSAAVLAGFAAGKLKKGWLVVLLGALVLIDMWPVDRRYMNDSSFVPKYELKQSYAIQDWEKEILQDKDPHFRIFNVTTDSFNDARSSYYLKSLGGIHSAKLRRYQDIIDTYLSKGEMKIINLLNAKYLIVWGYDGRPQPLPNSDAFGNAWFVGSLKTVEDAAEEIVALDKINLHSEAVLSKDFTSFVQDMHPGVAKDAHISLTSYTPRYIDYEYSTSTPGTVVFSEIYYPYGWKASIDGQPAEHFRADYILRAMNVPSGHHTIHFEFAPDSIRKGDAVAISMVVLMYLIIIGLIVGYYRKSHLSLDAVPGQIRRNRKKY